MSYFYFVYRSLFLTSKKSDFARKIQILIQLAAKLLLQKSTSFSIKISTKIMEEFLNIVKQQSSPQQEVSIDSNRLKFFRSKLKIWDYACLNFEDCKILSVEDLSPLLKSYYVDLASKYGRGSGMFLGIFSSGIFFLACCSF